MSKLSEIAIKPLRIAFDHYGMKDIYINAAKTAVKYGIKDLSNYLLYNYEDNLRVYIKGWELMLSSMKSNLQINKN